MGGIAWTREEDFLLMNCIKQYGEGKWHRVPQLSGLKRCRKSCRLRWLNYLRPNIKRGKFSDDEVDLIVKLHKLLGNRWSLIAGRLPGRTGNDIKNYWNHHLSKRLNPTMSSGHPVQLLRPQPRTIETTSSLLQQLHNIGSLPPPFLWEGSGHVQGQGQGLDHDQNHEVDDDKDKDDDDPCWFEECGYIYRQLFQDLQLQDLEVEANHGDNPK